VDFAFQVDQLSAVMLLVVTGVGSLIHLFSIGYMKKIPGTRYFAYLNLFVSSCWCSCWREFPVMFVGWKAWGCAAIC